MSDPLAPIPFHIAKAYGVARPASIRVAPARELERVDAVNQAPARKPEVARLVAARVPGGIDFTADEPRPSRETIAMYRHPADRNAAATGVQAGRLLDVDG